MNRILSKIKSDLESTGGPTLFHTDAFKALGAIGIPSAAHEIFDKHIEVLKFLAGEKEIVFPTFNYGFTKSRVYRPATDRCRVGILNEYVRHKNPAGRFGPPIFNFVSLDPDSRLGAEIKEQGEINAFGEDSFFGLLRKKKSAVVMYGAEFISFTATHYIEAMGNGPLYRYDKLFSGLIETTNGRTNPIDLKFHCRPLGQSLVYDIDKMLSEAVDFGVVKVHDCSGSKIIVIDFSGICDYWKNRLDEDPFYLLDKPTQHWVKQKYLQLGRRFDLADFEG